MKYLLFILLTSSSIAVAHELTINYESNPDIYINGDGFETLIIKPDGSGIRIGDLPSPIKDNDYDWKAFHEESQKHILEFQYSPEQYSEVLEQVLLIISEVKPVNDSLSGEGYTNFSISLWGNPSVEFRFDSIGGKDYPKSIYKLRDYIKLLSSPNKTRNEMDGSVEPPIR